MTILTVAAMVLSCVLTVCILRPLIPFLKSKKMGQKILEIGPRWHKNKEGTPMMGGLAFIAASLITLVASLIYCALNGGMTALLPAALVVGYGVLNALIGFVDDSAKLRKKQNEGLTARQKYLLQLFAAAVFLIFLNLTGVVATEMKIPFTGIELDQGIFYYIIALLLLTGVVNSVNLTDGIDGLSSSVTLVVGMFFTAAAFFSPAVENGESTALIGALLIGGTLGFLVYNFYPARIFMGDTGSLFLGAMAVGCAFIAGNPLIIVICGIIYMCEAASVILQVGYFKLTHGKRLFKMAPIHHHFEKCGWNEIRIVAVFAAVTALFSVLAWFGL